VLEVTDVAAGYGGEPVLRGVSLAVARRQCVAVVGESGSGKTTLVRTIAGMHREASGTITLEGQELRGDARERPRHVRREIQYIFQNPYASLNPRRTIEKCLAQPLRLFDRMSSGEVRDRVRSVLEHVELPPTILSSYPDQLSGGQRQRVAIARALIVEPTLLICDEITSALDVSIQAVVVEMLLRLRTQYGLSMLFVTHNLGLASSMADGIVVLRQGTVVESGFASTVLSQPSHEYTRSLLRDTPTLYNGESPPANAGRSSNPGESETRPHRG
jgi:peptide/nickel transport system ATP-binding protein